MGGPWAAKVPLLATHSIGPFSSYQWGKSPGWAGKAPAGPLVPTSKGFRSHASGWLEVLGQDEVQFRATLQGLSLVEAVDPPGSPIFTVRL